MTLNAGALQPLLAQLLLTNNKLSLLRVGTWMVNNLCRGEPQPEFALVHPALTTLGILIFQLDDEILTDACLALSCLSDGSNEKKAVVIESGVVMRVVELLMHPSTAVQTPALKTIGNLVSGGCHSVFYCSKEHQKIDWKLQTNGHKQHCKELQTLK